jgi:hypothetical protein
MMSKEQILKEVALFSLGTGGIGSWLTEQTDEEVFNRLDALSTDPLKKVQLNQLLVLGREAPISDGFFQYYWTTAPVTHPYPVESLPGFNKSFLAKDSIVSLDHLKWGLYRLYVDSLLYYGNVRSGYRALRAKKFEEIVAIFSARRVNTELTKARGPSLLLEQIPKDKRYLISEMACKSYGDDPESDSDLKKIILEAFRAHKANGKGKVTIGELLKGDAINHKYGDRQTELNFSAIEVLDEFVESVEDIEQKYLKLSGDFIESRNAALKNTRRYLSMVSDLDVYVATSMRNRKDFRDMADKTETIFADSRLRDLTLRYFDPTLSAANGHEDKGLIECLMVKCARVLVYCAGEKESYGKDAEAAMALSLGKPVIFLCDHEQRSRFYKEVHPLSRLIEFNTGVAVGAMVTDSLQDVSELLYRIFENKMEYELDHPKKGYLRLKDKVTGSIVRLQTNDPLLSETFWNHYHDGGR